MKIEEIPKEYTEGIRVLMLCVRNKDGGKSKPDHSARKIIVNGREEFIAGFEKLKGERKENERIYCTINARNINKAIREFKRRQLDADYFDEVSKNSFYLDIKNRFIGCLMAPNCRAETNFLIDIDEDDNEQEIKDGLLKIGINFDWIYSTKNGKHIITNPFNPNLLKAKIHKDGMILLDF